MAIISLVAKATVKLGEENKCKLSEFQEEIGMYGDFGFLLPGHSQHGIFLILLNQWKKKLVDKEVIDKGEDNDVYKNSVSNPLQMILDYDDDEEEKPTEPNMSEGSDILSARDAAVKGLIRQYCISHGVDEIQKIYDALFIKSLIDSDKFDSLFLEVREEVKHIKEHTSVQHEAKFDQTPTNKAPANPKTDEKSSPLVSSKGVEEEDNQEDLLSDKNQGCLPDEKLQALRRAKAQSLLRKRQLEVQQKTKSRRESFVQQSERDRQKKMAAIGQHKQMFLDSDSD
jgi:flagellar biosynthesis GTPase FlhF